ncbi:DUF421 domain-containing protein [Evansella sp. AB-rgal1]|uniref:DUF421 domain-containing protein n=1 Tax=Evansella sp. AB-rgal1 TaxID=3242696 RepID=UPI00359DAC20
MDFVGVEWIWKSALIVIGGIILLRVAGRKSISQMTLAQTVIMIGIGSLLIQPLAGENIWSTLFVGALLVITLLIVEYGQLKFDFIEQLVTGNSKVLIENGNINVQNLRSTRLTVDQLETQLRLNSISKMSDVKWATIEPNGQVAFVLKDEKKTATKKDIDEVKKEIRQIRDYINNLTHNQQQQTDLPIQQTQMMDNRQLLTLIHTLSNQINELKVNVDSRSSSKKGDQDLFREIKDESHNISTPEHLQ